MINLNQQKGFATLFVVLVLLTAMTAITAIMVRSGMLAQSINNNEGYTQDTQLAAENALEYQIAWLSTQAAQDALLVDGSIDCPKDSDCPTLPTLKGKDQSEFDLELTFGKPKTKYIEITVKANPLATDPNMKADFSCTVKVSGTKPPTTPPYLADCIPNTIVSNPSPSPLPPMPNAINDAIADSQALHINWLKTYSDSISIGSSLTCLYKIMPTSVNTTGLNPNCPKPTPLKGKYILPSPINLDVLIKPLPPSVSNQNFIELTAEAKQPQNNSRAVASCLVKVSGTTAPYQVARIPGTWKDWE